ncbi:class I SAM-dependent methyltransferase [Amycolatopsis sp. SID8362]|uniref:class I SAM-dependent methyltransferase n=1 Tax=Amycolatopsis sp. SID8362 TaxID=2690346 RepID=UPI00136983E9|nr:class I SAM-dependent methyltransferase [Amycolatopsis sp. SID8362]NBH06846.1 methyltransferase domain-containing protein [Amycolatopsis sp. SID8362]NED43543.1 class I SAM-dependent methyltransferase [Amycolatopsis sp. SID8362]
MSDPTRARRASSFGSRAAAYAEHRPDYPRAAIEWGLSGATGTPRRVLDLGAGTGKLTLGLTDLGLDVTAVEPDPEMRAELARRVPSATALAGRAERIPVPDAEVDAVFVGQAFHWFDVPAAMTEIGRVLRPGGVLVPMWNYEDESVPWVAEFTELGRDGARKPASTDDLREVAHPAFEPFDEERFHHVQQRTAETLLETIATYSLVIVSSPEESSALLTRLRGFLAANPATANGEFDLPLVTWGLRARRR